MDALLSSGVPVAVREGQAAVRLLAHLAAAAGRQPGGPGRHDGGGAALLAHGGCVTLTLTLTSALALTLTLTLV